MSTTYYFISDLHIGGDKKIDSFEFQEELIAFLKNIKHEKNSELIIIGDFLGLWEMTSVPENKKVEEIIKRHKKIFEQFKDTGNVIKITTIPGNHDHELLFNKDAQALLKKYRINFEPKMSIMRSLGRKKIWIEHGNQYDKHNRFINFYKKYTAPFGYFVSRTVISSAHKYSNGDHDAWIKDIASVYPNEEVPNWIFSNYFYKEMNPLIRYTILPFLLLLTISSIFGIGLLLNEIGLINSMWITPKIFDKIWLIGDVIEIIITINIIVLMILVAAAGPYIILSKDIKKALTKYGLKSKTSLKTKKEQKYIEAAKEVFKKNKRVKIFIYGHTHQASLKKIGDNIIINTGSMIKKLKRIKSRFRFLPSVYYPSNKLNYFKIYKEGKKGIIEFHEIIKNFETNLTFLERMVIFKRKKVESTNIPEKTIIKLK